MYSKGYADLTAMVRYAKSVKSVCTSWKETTGGEGVVNQVYDT